MKPKTVRLFVKTYCPWCHEAIAWLEERAIPFERLEVDVDSAAMNEMVELSGQRKAPVIEVDGDVLADFGADELGAWWKQKGLEPK